MIKYNSGLFDQNTSVGFDAALKYQKISKLLGLPASDIKEGVVMLTKSIRLLNMELGIPTSIKNAGIEESEYMGQVYYMAQNAMEDICTSGNPRIPSEVELRQILVDAYHGDI